MKKRSPRNPKCLDELKCWNQAMAKSRLLKGLMLADQMATFFMED